MKKPDRMPNSIWVLVKDNFDKIYEAENWMDYWEVRGSYCGDMRCMRFYSNGMVTER